MSSRKSIVSTKKIPSIPTIDGRRKKSIQYPTTCRPFVSLLNLDRPAQLRLSHCHTAASVTHIIQLRHLGLADMSRIAHCNPTVLAGIGFFNLLRTAEMSLLGRHHPTGFAFINGCSGFLSHFTFSSLFYFFENTSNDSKTFFISSRSLFPSLSTMT